MPFNITGNQIDFMPLMVRAIQYRIDVPALSYFRI